mmetsp:Transcript_39514/g.63367  ORF Transcript_39514/g.63367 Transcript_39514/m.63367 type:complete len:236 (-) Transcript_39514:322-1029(-)
MAPTPVSCVVLRRPGSSIVRLHLRRLLCESSRSRRCVREWDSVGSSSVCSCFFLFIGWEALKERCIRTNQFQLSIRDKVISYKFAFISLLYFTLRAVGLSSARGTAGGKDDADDEAVQGQRLGENEDEDHSGEQLGLLGVGANASVPHDADGHPGGEAREAARQARGEVRVPLEQGVPHRVNVGGDDYGDDEAVDAEHTSHDHGDDGLHDELGSHHTHGRDAHAGLGGTVCSTHA